MSLLLFLEVVLIELGRGAIGAWIKNVEYSEAEGEGGVVDASLLPPG